MLRSQMRNIAPFLTLIFLFGFFASRARRSRRSTISATS